MREVIYKPSLSAGSLVKLGFDTRDRLDLDFVTCGGNDDFVDLWERIDLETFPSCNDFHGRHVTVPKGTLAVIVDVVGVPDRVKIHLALRREPAPPDHRLIRNDFYVYDILVQGSKFQAFGCDMKLKN